MTQPQDHVTPPHLELLGAPEVRPFAEALADVRARWKAEVDRYREQAVERKVTRD